MDRLAPLSEVGLAATIPDGMKPGSDTANLAVLGYNPKNIIRAFLSKLSASASI